MINYNKLMKKLDDKGITTYVIRKKGLIPQSTLTKLKMCSGDSMEQIEKKLQEYKDSHNGKDFMCDVSTKTIYYYDRLCKTEPQKLLALKLKLQACS